MVPLGDSKAMRDAAAIRDRQAKHDEHLRMRHLECCVQALIEEIRGQKAKDYLKKMKAFEDYARGHSDPPKAAEMLQPSPCVQGNGPPKGLKHYLDETGSASPVGFPDPSTVGPHCDNCAKPMQSAFGSTVDFRMPQGHLRVVVCNHCMHPNAKWIKGD